MLEMAERGGSLGSPVDGISRQVDGRESQCPLEPMAQQQAFVIQAQAKGLGE